MTQTAKFCPYCQTPTPAAAERCHRCGRSLKRPSPGRTRGAGAHRGSDGAQIPLAHIVTSAIAAEQAEVSAPPHWTEDPALIRRLLTFAAVVVVGFGGIVAAAVLRRPTARPGMAPIDAGRSTTSAVASAEQWEEKQTRRPTKPASADAQIAAPVETPVVPSTETPVTDPTSLDSVAPAPPPIDIDPDQPAEASTPPLDLTSTARPGHARGAAHAARRGVRPHHGAPSER
jgi:hypothetical protein